MARNGPITALAPAKVNLNLHVTGRRFDGYHVLETLVVFADEAAADRISADHAGRDRLVVEGPAASELDDADDNLVGRARDWLQARVTQSSPVALVLEKHLPVASGLGGGSADAGATLRLLARLWGVPDAITAHAREAICAELGADVAMCIESRALIARGVGDELVFVDGVPELPAVLANPRVPLATPAVFGALRSRSNAAMPALPDRFDDVRSLADWLSTSTRNDLEKPARVLAPAIGMVLDALEQTHPLFVRMSGSGATCFALYETMKKAHAAADELAAIHDDWWIRPAMLNPQAELPLSGEAAVHVRA